MTDVDRLLYVLDGSLADPSLLQPLADAVREAGVEVLADGLLLLIQDGLWPYGVVAGPLDRLKMRRSMVRWDMFLAGHERRPHELPRGLFDALFSNSPRAVVLSLAFVSYSRRSDAVLDLAWAITGE